MNNAYDLTYTIPGGIKGKVNTILAESMAQAVKITFGLYRHIEETGEVTKQTDEQSVIKAEGADLDNPNKVYNYTYKLTKL